MLSFHAVLTAGADRFFGAARKDRGGHSLLDRAFDHGRMKRSRDDVSRLTLTPAHLASAPDVERSDLLAPMLGNRG